MESKRFLIIIFAAGVCIILAFLSFHIARRAHLEILRIGTMGTIPSILAFVHEMDEQQLQALDISLSEEWRIFSAGQYDDVIEALRKTGRLDVDASKWTQNGTFVDPWGRPYLIAGRKKEDGREFMVWSKGPDGISATEDDIVRPYKSVVPESLK
jgi:hypothetical protein